MAKQTLDPKVLELLNKQINIELGNAVLYRQISALANKLGYLGCESWSKKQYEDELTHFNLFFEYLVDRNYIPEIRQIVEPGREYKSLKEIFDAALEREEQTTEEIKKIRQTAIDKDDQLTEQFLLKLIEEQIEELSTIYDIQAKITASRDEASALMLVDEFLGER